VLTPEGREAAAAATAASRLSFEAELRRLRLSFSSTDSVDEECDNLGESQPGRGNSPTLAAMDERDILRLDNVLDKELAAATRASGPSEDERGILAT
tara:strand:+ start:384 stop:674 length:291 start_codon:yes stop_codon:yes gene_type:complete